MKKYLMRAGMSPLSNYDAFKVLMKDTIGGNSGNMLFQNSIFKALLSDETKIDVNNYVYNLDDCDKINEEYDAFIIPLANAFRPNYAEMDKLLPFVKKLKIPCIVTGVGAQLSYEPDFSRSYDFDEKCKEFCKAVLERSSTIGVRGGITEKYLEKLGFKNHIRVIGCPSMFLNGSSLEIKEKKKLNYKSKVAFNAQMACPQNVWAFFENSFDMFEEYYYISQNIKELQLLYAGNVWDVKKSINYPTDSSHYLIQENRMRFFINAQEWLAFLSQLDFSIGMKIHGSIAAILAGIPTFLIAHDSRTRELAEYHNIPHIKYTEINEKTNPYTIYESADFSSVKKGYDDRFANFVSFLDENGLDNIYSQGKEKEFYFQNKINEINFDIKDKRGIESILHVSPYEAGLRLDQWSNHIHRKIKKLENGNK